MRLIDADAAADKIMHEIEVNADEIGATAIMIAFARALRDETYFSTIDPEVMRMNKIELKPCPFCGYDKISIQSRNRETWWSGGGEYAYYKTFSARCKRCGARGPTVVALCDVSEKTVIRYGKEEKVKSYKQLRDEATEAWNRRGENG